ncbi:MAG: hypothetical protein AB7K24_11545 [Gemmataceae bacterium]
MERTPLPIENCRAWFKFLCPKTWGQLERTELIDVRYCGHCRRNVYLCDSMAALEEHRARGDCICVLATAAEEDVEESLGMMGEV